MYTHVALTCNVCFIGKNKQNWIDFDLKENRTSNVIKKRREGDSRGRGAGGTGGRRDGGQGGIEDRGIGTGGRKDGGRRDRGQGGAGGSVQICSLLQRISIPRTLAA